jgi:hypothetical protein
MLKALVFSIPTSKAIKIYELKDDRPLFSEKEILIIIVPAKSGEREREKVKIKSFIKTLRCRSYLSHCSASDYNEIYPTLHSTVASNSIIILFKLYQQRARERASERRPDLITKSINLLCSTCATCELNSARLPGTTALSIFSKHYYYKFRSR